MERVYDRLLAHLSDKALASIPHPGMFTPIEIVVPRK